MSDYKIKKGRWGEQLAEEYLRKAGYRILERNYRCKWGEIDIIAMKDSVIHFVEVKTRRNSDYGSPLSAITPVKMLHIHRTAEHYIYSNNLYNFDISIDGVGICNGELEFIENIW